MCREQKGTPGNPPSCVPKRFLGPLLEFTQEFQEQPPVTRHFLRLSRHFSSCLGASESFIVFDFILISF